MAWIECLSRHDSQESLFLFVQIALFELSGRTCIARKLTHTQREKVGR